MPTLDRPRIEYRTPVDLVRELRNGSLRIPPFQRGFKWESTDVIALFDSLLRGFPIGNLLLWRRPAPAATVRIGPLQIEAARMDSAYWVVDGQQRVTSLGGALLAAEEATDPRFRVFLDLETARFHSLGVRQQAPRQWLPVNQLVETTALLTWMRSNAEWLTDAHLATADAVAKAVREYQIPTYIVDTDDESALRQIFDRLNNTGKPLTKAEVFHALHSGLSGEVPSDLRSIGAVSAEAGFGSIDDRLALRCVLAYRGGDLFRDDFHDEFVSDTDREETFREVATILRVVVDLLRGEVGIPHLRLLPYSHVIPVLVRFVRVHGEPSDRLARLLRRWVWRDAIGGLAARGTSVAAVRQAIEVLDAEDPYDAAETLLSLAVDRGDFRPDLSKVHLNHAAAKVNLLGLLSARPVDPATGQPFDPAVLFDAGHSTKDIVKEIVADHSLPLADGFANRVVLGRGLNRTARSVLSTASAGVRASHLIDDAALEFLRSGQDTEFLEARAALVERAIREHVGGMAEWGARGGRSIADMIRTAA
ncbi:DUF262 domain-containing protein [Catenuloplanes atrovinosus]|uniref:GmrSD restriction endonucleases N-terminal domain-containing protein n=1 Tax=Catenuloplanes atrovinosus TaxID=137266 RepID=A0AAE3YXF7_9ACTN|nr:DUF262 domain-containing protein [Catenuloplanes atrovinosus]MDR7280188.1 hypothetical protein [Catenuloplanes atrovinosus]